MLRDAAHTDASRIRICVCFPARASQEDQPTRPMHPSDVNVPSYFKFFCWAGFHVFYLRFIDFHLHIITFAAGRSSCSQQEQ